jgi:phage portal protein BeeE
VRASTTCTRASTGRARRSCLGAGAKVQPLSLSPIEAALIEQRKLNREEVAIVYDLGGPSLSDITDNSLGNVAERNRAFYRDVLPPWTELVVQTFESQLVDQEPAWMDRSSGSTSATS